MANYPQPVLVPTRPWPAIVSATIVAVFAILSVTALEIWGGESHTPTILTIMGFATALTASLVTLVKVNQVSSQVDRLHQSVATLPQEGTTPQEQEVVESVLVKTIAAEVVKQMKKGETSDVSD